MKSVMVAMGRRTISELLPVKRRYRSGFEEKLAQQIEDAELEVQYETITLGYTWPARESRYTPDFALDKPDGTQMLLEGKGLFDTEARAKMLLVKDKYPDLDLRLVFSNANARIHKKSQTTYAMWAEKHGFPYSHKEIPSEWLAEAKPPKK